MEPDFSQQAEQDSPGIVREFWEFLGENKKWWLIPILVAVCAICGFVFVSTSAVAPLLYPFF